MKIDTRPRHKNSPRPAEKNCPAFLQWLRGRTPLCAAPWDCCEGKTEAAHVDYAGDKGIGTKVADRYAIPLCALHHRLQHDKGWKWFERTVLGCQGVALKAAEQYWQQWPGRIAWERKLRGGA